LVGSHVSEIAQSCLCQLFHGENKTKAGNKEIVRKALLIRAKGETKHARRHLGIGQPQGKSLLFNMMHYKHRCQGGKFIFVVPHPNISPNDTLSYLLRQNSQTGSK
jgi:hypothetical protein